MRTSELGELAAFAAIAREGSFRRAAAQLNLKPTTLSHTLRTLEERLGVRLLNRTTRSVALPKRGSNSTPPSLRRWKKLTRRWKR